MRTCGNHQNKILQGLFPDQLAAAGLERHIFEPDNHLIILQQIGFFLMMSAVVEAKPSFSLRSTLRTSIRLRHQLLVPHHVSLVARSGGNSKAGNKKKEKLTPCLSHMY